MTDSYLMLLDSFVFSCCQKLYLDHSHETCGQCRAATSLVQQDVLGSEIAMGHLATPSKPAESFLYYLTSNYVFSYIG